MLKLELIDKLSWNVHLIITTIKKKKGVCYFFCREQWMETPVVGYIYWNR